MFYYNSKGENHNQFADRVKPLRACNAHDGNFGGSCFNCGFQPTQKTATINLSFGVYVESDKPKHAISANCPIT